jgi:hypothetical protein
MDAVTSTVLSTAEAMAPAILAAAGAANPGLAGAAALAPVALQLLQAATQFQQAGAMTPAQLAAVFATVGAGIKTSHDAWVAGTTKAA